MGIKEQGNMIEAIGRMLGASSLDDIEKLSVLTHCARMQTVRIEKKYWLLDKPADVIEREEKEALKALVDEVFGPSKNGGALLTEKEIEELLDIMSEKQVGDEI